MIRDIEDVDTILNQFLDYARDGSEEAPEAGDLDALAGEMGQRYRDRGRSVTVELGHTPRFVFRPLAVRRAVANLVDNAVRYGRSEVRIVTAVAGDQAILAVADNGPGILAAAPEYFIRAFTREDASRSETGAGLGLTIVDRIARMHGGTFRLANRPEGGLLATIQLPLGSPVL
jgi:two-component system osmolarity sensor histidine kinase EnvZ